MKNLLKHENISKDIRYYSTNQSNKILKIIVQIYKTKNIPSLTIKRHLLFHFEEVHNQRELSFHDY